ncbi:MAG: hypothetical protein J1F27_07735 [Prevotellaceae bacterium]|nr:hypothetical protein [Prevotellaceae bacterium]
MPIIPLLFALMFPFMQVDTIRTDTVRTDNTQRVDTLKEVEVRGDSTLRVNDAIREAIGRERKSRLGTPKVSDIIGGKATDMVLHPFAVKDRKRDRKHARDHKILKEYEELGRVKTFEELLDEAVRQQAIDDGEEPPKRSGKKK